jgi:hypothetical protein
MKDFFLRTPLGFCLTMCAFVIAIVAAFILLLIAPPESLSILNMIIDVAQIIAPLAR